MQNSGMNRRASGILLHISSLPNHFGIGDLGPEAYRFADFLRDTGQSYWQILPLTLTDTAHGNSPYSSISAFAGNELFISPELLFSGGLISRQTLSRARIPSKGRVDYAAVTAARRAVLEEAYENFPAGGADGGFAGFEKQNAYWLEDYALFRSMKIVNEGLPWSRWPDADREREPGAVKSFREKYPEFIRKEKFKQFIFQRQWADLKSYCNRQGIQVIGDLPIYVNYDSVEVWSNPEIFQLDAERKPRRVAGVPPDYFSDTGQLWGNPLYDWKYLAGTGYHWWIKRLERNFQLYNLTRVDHFRGLIGYWQVPYGSKTAIDGEWKKAPFADFFNTLLRRFACLPVIVEDLGVITPDVREMMLLYDLAGMKVLMFAFGEDNPTHPYLPHMYPGNCVAYTGTHDTNTLRGWYEEELDGPARKRVRRYLGTRKSGRRLGWELVRILMMSAADSVLFPLQDLLWLPSAARMNYPGREAGWRWKLQGGELTGGLARRLGELTRLYGRT